MAGFLIYLTGFFLTWYLGARILYNSEFLIDLAEGKGEAAGMSLGIAGIFSIGWFITLPLIVIFYLVGFVSNIYGGTLTDSLDKLLDNRRR